MKVYIIFTDIEANDMYDDANPVAGSLTIAK